MKKHLITWENSGSRAPINHGLVEIDDRGWVDGETPIEDFGMFFYRDEPFPEDKNEIFQIFFNLMEEQAYGLDSELDGKTVLQWIEESPERIKEMIYFGGEFKEEVIEKL